MLWPRILPPESARESSVVRGRSGELLPYLRWERGGRAGIREGLPLELTVGCGGWVLAWDAGFWALGAALDGLTGPLIPGLTLLLEL